MTPRKILKKRLDKVTRFYYEMPMQPEYLTIHFCDETGRYQVMNGSEVILEASKQSCIDYCKDFNFSYQFEGEAN